MDNLKLHIVLSTVSLKLIQLMTELNPGLVVFTCNFNIGELKSGVFRV